MPNLPLMLAMILLGTGLIACAIVRARKMWFSLQSESRRARRFTRLGLQLSMHTDPGAAAEPDRV